MFLRLILMKFLFKNFHVRNWFVIFEIFRLKCRDVWSPKRAQAGCKIGRVWLTWRSSKMPPLLITVFVQKMSYRLKLSDAFWKLTRFWFLTFIISFQFSTVFDQPCPSPPIWNEMSPLSVGRWRAHSHGCEIKLFWHAIQKVTGILD